MRKYILMLVVVAAGFVPAQAQEFGLSCCLSNGCNGAARSADEENILIAPLTATNTVSGVSSSSSYNVNSRFGVLNGSASCAAGGISGFTSAAGFSSDLPAFRPVTGFLDTLTLTSATLPAGTPVQVQITCSNFDGITQNFGGNAGLGDIAECAGAETLIITDARSNVVSSNSVPLGSFANGASGSVQVTNSLSTIVTQFPVGTAFEIHNGLTDAGSVKIHSSGGGSASIADNMTSVTYVNILTPGVNYTSASGIVYPTWPTVAPPMLLIQPAGNQIIAISWPGTYTNYILQQNPAPGTAGWVSNNCPASLTNGSYQVVVASATGSMFYRLAPP